MRHIAMYISSHGYGHLTRCLAVIGSLLEEKNITVTAVLSPDHVDFARNYFAEIGLADREASSLNYHTMRTDIGTLVVAGSMEIDIPASRKQAEEFAASWPTLLAGEEKYYREESAFGLPNLLVGDIVPWSFLLAERLGIPSIAISNFTWLDTCKHFFPEALYQAYAGCYQKADLCLAYDLAMPSMHEAFRKTEDISLIMRRVNPKEAEKIHSAFSNPMVYISIGGLVGLSEVIDVSGLPYDFVCTSGVHMVGENVHPLPKDAHTQNVMAAADFVITKPGWSTTAEALSLGKPLGLIDRPDSYEDQSTMKYLLERRQCVKLEQSQLSDMKLVMERLEALKNNHGSYPYEDASGEIVRRILDFL